MRTAELVMAPVAESDARADTWISGVAGFFFATRMLITYAGFQSDPRVGSAVTALMGGMVFLAAAFFAQEKVRQERPAPVMRWLLVYLVFTGASLWWSETESRAVASVYWVGLALDAWTGWLLVRGARAGEQVEAMMRGFIFGAGIVALVAWSAPTLPDMRIGDEDFLHPNALGMEFAIGLFFAQHLGARERRWRWWMAILGISLLRTLSKTSILAAVAAEVFYLVRGRHLSRRTKAGIAAGALVVLGVFWGLMERYLQLYAQENQAETLTGRTVIWAMTLVMGMERPCFGHGIYSFRGLIPAFGDFQPWHAHNELLQQFFESGLAGVVMMLGMYGSALLSGLRRAADGYGTLTAALVILCLVRGLADTVNFGLSMPFWLLVPLAEMLRRSKAAEVAA